MRILVTGATGFIASHLIPFLGAAGHEVVATGHDPSRIPRGTPAFALDLASPDWPALPVVDAVVHLAQSNTPFPEGAGALFAVNAAATQRLLDHARLTGTTHFVLASSGSVYGMSDDVLTERSTLAARDFYAATKVAAERCTEAYAGLMQTTILRLFVPYGPGQVQRMLPRLAERVRTGETIRLNRDGRPRMNPIYVADVCRTILRALDSDSGGGIINVAGDDVTDVRTVSELIGTILGIAPTFVEGDGQSQDIVADNSALHAFLGDAPLVTLREGLEQCLRSSTR